MLFEIYHKNHNNGMDITVTNDYTRDSMLKGCDEVIDMINKLFSSQEAVRDGFTRKSDSDLLRELGASRIEVGAARAENCELFKPHLVEELEK